MKKLIAGALSAALLMTPMAAAASDLDGNWAKSYIEYLEKIPYNGESGGVIRPNATTGNYDPDKQVTRAEFMRYLNRAFNFTEKAAVSQYTDLNASGWYIDTVQVASKHGYISGTSATTMSPTAPITREQVVSVMGRLFKKNLPEISPQSLPFLDNDSIGKWSAAYIKDAVEDEIVYGYNDSTFRPGATVTRAEIASLLYFYMGTSLNQEGAVYTASDIKSDTKNVTISAPCALQDAVIEGDLYITEGVTGSVTLTDVTIHGDLIQSGGLLLCNGVAAGRLVVDSPMGRLVETIASGDTMIGETVIRSASSLAEKDLTGVGFVNVSLEGSGAPSLTMDGTADVSVVQKATITTTTSTMIGTLNANAPVTVSGYGSIGSALLNSADCSLAMAPLSGYTVLGGETALINGSEVSGTGAGTGGPQSSVAMGALPSSNPTSFTFDRNPEVDNQALVVSVGGGGFGGVRLGNAELKSTLSNGSVTVDVNTLSDIPTGTYTLTFRMDSGKSPTVELKVIDTSGLAQYDVDADWSGKAKDDIEFYAMDGIIYNDATLVSSVKCGVSNLASQTFRCEVERDDRLRVTLDGEEVAKWFEYYGNPAHLDFDVKLTDMNEAFCVRVWREK